MQAEMQAMLTRQLSLENEIKEVKDKCTKLSDDCTHLKAENKQLNEKLSVLIAKGADLNPSSSAEISSPNLASVVRNSVKSALKDENAKSEVIITNANEEG